MMKIYSILVSALLMVAATVSAASNPNNELSLNFTTGQYLYTVYATDSVQTSQPFVNNWWWNDNTNAAAPSVKGNVLKIGFGSRSAVASDDMKNPYASPVGLAITTPKVKLNTAKYPLMAVKFKTLPLMADSGNTMFGYRPIVRASSTTDAKNHDWYFRVDPAADKDAVYCTHLEDEDGGTILVFDLSKSGYVFRDQLKLVSPATDYVTQFAAAEPGMVMPMAEGIETDQVFAWEGVKDTLQTATIAWMKSFETMDDVYAYAFPEAAVNPDNALSLDYRSGNFLYTVYADSTVHTDNPFANNWWWNDNTKAVPPTAEDGVLKIGFGERTAVASDDMKNPYASPFGLAITTPKVRLNTAKYPLMAVKFNVEPEMAEGNSMFGYRPIVRASSTTDAKNHDWYFRVDPAADKDAVYCTHLEDEDGGMIYVFDYTKSGYVYRDQLKLVSPATDYITQFAAASEGMVIPLAEGIETDQVFAWEGVKDANQKAQISWMKSFETMDDVYAFAFTTAVKQVQKDVLKVSVANGVVRMNNLETGTKVDIYDLTGALRINRTVTNNSFASYLNQGVYVIKVTNGTEIKTTKVVVY